MQINILASGSKGNVVHVASADTALLVDIGLSCKQTELRFARAGLDPAGVRGIFVTHEHFDHIGGISVFSRRYNVPVYVTAKLWDRLARTNPNWYDVIPFEPGCELDIGDIRVRPYRTSHDADDPVAYTFFAGGRKVGHLTDCGVATAEVKDALKDCDLLLLESNHDERLLKSGPYPRYLKSRIASNKGHLSNLQASNLLKQLINPRLEAVCLLHLSEENNTPELAYNASAQMLRYADKDISLHVAGQHLPTPTIRVKPLPAHGE